MTARRALGVGFALWFCTGCPFGPDVRQWQFACSSDDDRTAGFQCIGGTCVLPATDSDSGTGPGDAGRHPSPDGGAAGDGGRADAGCAATLSGTVFDPSGQLPLWGATVYVPSAALRAFPPAVVCKPCSEWISGNPVASAVTDADGGFRLTGVPSGPAVPLVVQLGRWRKQVHVAVQGCADNAVDASLLALPRNQAEGDIPRIAVVTGSGDAPECTLLKLGLSQSEFTAPDGGGRIHLYRSNGAGLPNTPSSAILFENGAAGLLPYDLLLLPCQGSAITPRPADVSALESYAGQGGRFATSHFTALLIQDAPAPFPSTASWRSSAANATPPSPTPVAVQTDFSAGRAFAGWLEQVGAAQASVLSLSSPEDDVGVVRGGTRDWIHGDSTGQTAGTTYNWTPYLSFETPVGASSSCGRVGHFDFHVSPPAGLGTTFPASCAGGPFTADELAFVFQLFELGQCASP